MSNGLQVFVLGSARSGTSITYYVLREVFNLPGAGESHVMPAFQRAFHLFHMYHKGFVENHSTRGVLACKLSPREFREHNLEYIRSFYRSHYKDGSWVDKTPGAEAILGVPLILDAFPDARLIVTKRTGIEVVRSFQAKFSSAFEDACNAWANSMNAIRRTRASCPGLLEVDQYDMTNAPQQVAESLADHLAMPDKRDAVAEYLMRQRPDRRSTHDWSRRLMLADVDWSEAERNTFRRICGELMDEFSYPM